MIAARRLQVVRQLGEAALKLYHRQLRDAFRIHSHLTTHERIALNRLAHGRTAICEIGSYVGASACCFGAAIERDGAGKIFCIDTWQNDAMSEGNRDTYAEFRSNTARYAELIITMRGFSTALVEDLRTRTPRLDLLFIDGDHSFAGVKADWHAYCPFLEAGSIVVFHDYGWAEGVRRVVEEDVKPRVVESAALPNMWWGTIR